MRRDTHDRSTSLRHDGKSISLGHRGAASGPISPRLADAGYPWRDAARRRHDVSCVTGAGDPVADRPALGVAAHASRRAGEFTSALAAAELGSSALAAVRAGFGNDYHRLAVRFVSRLVHVFLLYFADA